MKKEAKTKQEEKLIDLLTDARNAAAFYRDEYAAARAADMFGSMAEENREIAKIIRANKLPWEKRK